MKFLFLTFLLLSSALSPAYCPSRAAKKQLNQFIELKEEGKIIEMLRFLHPAIYEELSFEELVKETKLQIESVEKRFSVQEKDFSIIEDPIKIKSKNGCYFSYHMSSILTKDFYVNSRSKEEAGQKAMNYYSHFNEARKNKALKINGHQVELQRDSYFLVLKDRHSDGWRILTYQPEDISYGSFIPDNVIDRLKKQVQQ